MFQVRLLNAFLINSTKKICNHTLNFRPLPRTGTTGEDTESAAPNTSSQPLRRDQGDDWTRALFAKQDSITRGERRADDESPQEEAGCTRDWRVKRDRHTLFVTPVFLLHLRPKPEYTCRT